MLSTFMRVIGLHFPALVLVLALFTVLAVPIASHYSLNTDTITLLLLVGYFIIGLPGLIICLKPLTDISFIHQVQLITSTSLAIRSTTVSVESIRAFYREVRDNNIDLHPIKALWAYFRRVDALYNSEGNHEVYMSDLLKMSPDGLPTLVEFLDLGHQRILHHNNIIMANTKSNIAAALDKLDIDYTLADNNLIVSITNAWESVITTALHIVATSLHLNRKPEAAAQLYQLLGNKTISIGGQPLDAERLARWAHRRLLEQNPITRPEPSEEPGTTLVEASASAMTS